MHIPEKILHKICQQVLDSLKEKKLVTLKVPEEKILQRMIKAFTDDLHKEIALNEEVKKMLEKFRRQIDAGEIDEQKMFQMIKKQLIKERNIIL